MLALAVAVAPAPAPAPAAADCPPAAMVWPRYPAKQLRGGTPGKTIVLARIDECGRVVEAKVDTGSGHMELDAAALAAAKASVLSPEQMARVPTGWVKLPFAFSRAKTITPVAPDWPKSHKRPRYLPDDQPMGYETIAALSEARLMRDVMLKSPYASVGLGGPTQVTTWFHQERDNPRHFWLAYTVLTSVPDGAGGRRYDSDTVAMARYRLVEENGESVVRLGLLCEATPEECSQLSTFLFKGLPIARPPRQ